VERRAEKGAAGSLSAGRVIGVKRAAETLKLVRLLWELSLE
jgi:hypothetical protein